MISPGTGAGMQARAAGGIDKVVDTLSGFLKNYDPQSEEFGALYKCIQILTRQFKQTPPKKSESRPPISFPPVPPGQGLGGLPPPMAAQALAGEGGGENALALPPQF